MPTLNKPLYRASRRIYRQLAKPAATPASLSLPTSQWNCLMQLGKSIELAECCGWRLAAQCRRTDVLRQVEELGAC